jgi:hypothetical protein
MVVFSVRERVIGERRRSTAPGERQLARGTEDRARGSSATGGVVGRLSDYVYLSRVCTSAAAAATAVAAAQVLTDAAELGQSHSPSRPTTSYA